MQPNLFLIFNHEFTACQRKDARKSLNVAEILSLPEDLQSLWGEIPPELSAIADYLKPLQKWLSSHARKDDYLLIQGDFGACYLMVRFAFLHGLIPIYSTTRREAAEELQPDGSIRLMHLFEHKIFRKYGS